MENEEILKIIVVIGYVVDFVEYLINKFFVDSVVIVGIVVGGVFFFGNYVFGVEEVMVGISVDFIDDVGFEIVVDCLGNIFVIFCLGIYLLVGLKDMRVYIIKGFKYVLVLEKKVLKLWLGLVVLCFLVRYLLG